MADTIIFCEECGHRNTVSSQAIKDSDSPVRCSGCSDILRIVHKDEKNQEVLVKKGGGDDKLF